MSRELALHYLQRHYVPDSEFGSGPFLLRNGQFELFTHPCFETNGILLIKTLTDKIIECNSLSHAVYYDIVKNDPQLTPILIKEEGHGTLHNWVRIFSPDQIYDIDCSPWYRSIQYKQIGIPRNPSRDIYVTFIEPQAGGPFFLSQIDGKFICSYLMGAPSVFYFTDAKSDYTLLAEIRVENCFASGIEKYIGVYLSVTNIATISFDLEHIKSLKELIRRKKLTLGVGFSKDPDIIHPFCDVQELTAAVHEIEGPELASQMKRHAKALFKLVKKFPSSIPIYQSRAGAIEFENHRPSRILNW